MLNPTIPSWMCNPELTVPNIALCGVGFQDLKLVTTIQYNRHPEFISGSKVLFTITPRCLPRTGGDPEHPSLF